MLRLLFEIETNLKIASFEKTAFFEKIEFVVLIAESEAAETVVNIRNFLRFESVARFSHFV